MKRNNNKKFKANIKGTKNMGLNNVIPLYSQRVVRNISYPGIIYQLASGLVSFTTPADTRYLAFSTLLTSTEFTTIAAAYADYKILSINIALQQLDSIPTATTVGILYADVYPLAVPGNPTNLTVMESDASRLFSSVGTVIQHCVWTMPGTSLTTNIWISTSATPILGEFVIGSNPVITGSSSNLVFDYRIGVTCMFASPK